MAEKDKICGLFDGDEVFKRFQDLNGAYSERDVEMICRYFITEMRYAPFNLLYNISYDIGMQTDDDLIGLKDLFGDPQKHLALAKTSSKGFTPYLREVKDTLLKNLSLLGQIWLRRFSLCEPDDAEFVYFLFSELYIPVIKANNVDVRETFMGSLSRFHLEAYTIKKIDEYIWEEEKRLGKHQFFSSKLRDEKLIAIKNILVDCKGANYNVDQSFISPISDDDWLHIFGRKYVSNPKNPVWLKANQVLMDTLSIVCGKGATLKPLVTKYFGIENPPQVDGRKVPVILSDAINRIVNS